MRPDAPRRSQTDANFRFAPVGAACGLSAIGVHCLSVVHRDAGLLRVIYYWDPAESGIYLLFLYPKNRQEDLTPEQLKLLRRIVQEDLK